MQEACLQSYRDKYTMEKNNMPKTTQIKAQKL